MAQSVYSLKKYKLAETSYLRLIEHHSDKLKNIFYVERAQIRFLLKNLNEALADLNQYKELTENDDIEAKIIFVVH